MNKVVFACFLAGFFLFRPYFMQSNGMMYGYGVGDDYNYFAHASVLAFGQFPSYKNECFTNGHAIGSGIMAAPFVWAFSFLDRFEGSDIILVRTADNIIGSWSQFGFFFSSVLFFCLGCLLLYLAVKLHVKPSYAAWAVIAMVICQGIPLFAYRRPVFSHSFEFFLQSFFVFLFLKNEFNKGQWIKSWWSFVLLGVAAALIFLTRYNNFLFALAWPLFFVGRNGQAKSAMVRQLLWIFIPFTCFIVFFKVWPEIYNAYSPYGLLPFLFNTHATFGDVIKRIGRILFGFDWGLFFTAPFMFFALDGLGIWKSGLKKRYLLLMLPLIANIYTIIFFGSQGGWYGYRYLIASAFPLLVLPLALVLERVKNMRFGSVAMAGFVMIAAMPLVSMLAFECNNPVNLNLLPVDFGRQDWTHNFYQLAAWKTVLDVQTYWTHLLQGGPLYFYYVCTKIQSWFGLLIDQHVVYISWYDIKIFIKVLIIYSIPFVLGYFFKERVLKRAVS